MGNSNSVEVFFDNLKKGNVAGMQRNIKANSSLVNCRDDVINNIFRLFTIISQALFIDEYQY
jgi:hypothetical protein